MDIRAATFPADAPLVRSLFREYAHGLGIDLSFQRFAEELAELPGKYVPPSGGLWIATVDDDVAGCVALRPLVAGTCEMKRLYLRPAFRGRGAGRMLVSHALSAAAAMGYRRICLDTLPSMKSAIELYRSLGFVEVERYTHNPVPGAMWFAKELEGS
jgi:ribosomal protein S18 acetylase RimI-like enzyme